MCFCLTDCCRSTAVMSTNATSFLLLNLYRTGVSLDILVEAMDKLRDQIRVSDRDLGFIGESVDVVNHAVSSVNHILNLYVI